MFGAFFEGLWLVLQWPAIGYMLLGVAIGIWLGAVPGLNGLIGLVMLLPFTYGMESVPAFALLLGMFSVTATSDTITSVLLGIPGSAASQATVLDGYPLAQRGEAQRALGAAFAASAYGGVFGALVLAVSLPLILPIVTAIASPEMFMLGMLGLAMVGSLAGSSILKGLIVALFGLLLATIGYAEVMALPRFTFGSMYLLDGLPLIPLVLGIFGIPEVIDLATKNTSIVRTAKEDRREVTVWDGVKDTWTHRWLATRSSIIGTYVGLMPGLGASIVDWLAYGHAVQSSKDKSQFGKGDIRGVIAPEAANNATKGGGLIPTVAFGIPGNISSAILLGALLIQGLRPGPDMLTTHLPVTFSMVWTIVISSLLATVVLMYWSGFVAKIAFIPGHLLVPSVVAFMFMGAWVSSSSMGDWVLCLGAGVVGFMMKRGGWPRPPLILALVLGPILENAFQLSMRVHEGLNWLGRPIVLVLLAGVVITILLSARGVATTRKSGVEVSKAAEGGEQSPFLSLSLGVLILVGSVWAAVESGRWPWLVQQFPIMLAVPAAAMALLAVGLDLRASRRLVVAEGGIGPAWRLTERSADLGPSIRFIAGIVAMILASLVVGQIVALVGYMMIYLWRWGRYGWRLIWIYGLCAAVYVYVLYDRIMHLYWQPSLLNGFYAWVVQSLHLPIWLAS